MLQELLDQVNRYLVGNSAERDLETWLVANLQVILNSGDSATIDLANEVDAGLMEVKEGILDHKGFWDRLNAVVNARRTLGFDNAEISSPVKNELSDAATTILIVMEAFKSLENIRLKHSFA